MDPIDFSVFSSAAFTIHSGPRAHHTAPAPTAAASARIESVSPVPSAQCPVRPWVVPAQLRPLSPQGQCAASERVASLSSGSTAPVVQVPPAAVVHGASSMSSRGSSCAASSEGVSAPHDPPVSAAPVQPAHAEVHVEAATVVRSSGLSVTTQRLDIPQEVPRRGASGPTPRDSANMRGEERVSDDVLKAKGWTLRDTSADRKPPRAEAPRAVEAERGRTSRGRPGAPRCATPSERQGLRGRSSSQGVQGRSSSARRDGVRQPVAAVPRRNPPCGRRAAGSSMSSSTRSASATRGAKQERKQVVSRPVKVMGNGSGTALDGAAACVGREQSFEDEMVRSAAGSAVHVGANSSAASSTAAPTPQDVALLPAEMPAVALRDSESAAARSGTASTDGATEGSPAHRAVAAVACDASVLEPMPLAAVSSAGAFRCLGAFDVNSEERDDGDSEYSNRLGSAAASSTEDRSASQGTSRTASSSAHLPVRSGSATTCRTAGTRATGAPSDGGRSRKVHQKLRERGWVSPKRMRPNGPLLTSRVVSDDIPAQPQPLPSQSSEYEGSTYTDPVSTTQVVQRLFPSQRALERRRRELEERHAGQEYVAPRTRSTGPIVRRLSRPLDRKVRGYAGHDQTEDHTYKPKLCAHDYTDGNFLNRLMGPVWERLTKEKDAAADVVVDAPAPQRKQKDVIR